MVVARVRLASGRELHIRLQARARVSELRARIRAQLQLSIERHRIDFIFPSLSDEESAAAPTLIRSFNTRSASRDPFISDLPDGWITCVLSLQAVITLIHASEPTSPVPVGMLSDLQYVECGHPFLDRDGNIRAAPGGTEFILSIRCGPRPEENPVVSVREEPAFRSNNPIIYYDCAGVVMESGDVVFAPADASCVWVSQASGRDRLISPRLPPGRLKYRSSAPRSTDGHAYFAPFAARRFLRVSPTLTWEFVGPRFPDLSRARNDFFPVGWFCGGGILGCDGNIYFAPYDFSDVVRVMDGGVVQIVEIRRNFVELSRTPFALPEHISEDHGSRWLLPLNRRMRNRAYACGGVQNSSGMIYFAPTHGTRMLVVDPLAALAILIGPILYPNMLNSAQFESTGVLMPDGACVFAPSGLGHMMKITPAGDVVEFGTRMVALFDARKFVAPGILAADGCAYFAPFDYNYLLRVVDSDTVQTIFLNNDPSQWDQMQIGRYRSRGCVGPDGCIYFLPWQTSEVLRIWPASGG